MSTRQRAVMPCNWGVNAGMVREWVAGKTVWSPCCHGPYLSALAMGSSHNRALYKCPITLLYYFTLPLLSDRLAKYSYAISGIFRGGFHEASPSRCTPKFISRNLHAQCMDVWCKAFCFRHINFKTVFQSASKRHFHSNNWKRFTPPQREGIAAPASTPSVPLRRSSLDPLAKILNTLLDVAK